MGHPLFSGVNSQKLKMDCPFLLFHWTYQLRQEDNRANLKPNEQEETFKVSKIDYEQKQ